MELWFSEFHAPDVKHSIRVNRHLYSKRSDYQQIDIFDTPEFGRVLALDGNVMLTERDEFIYDEMITHVPMAVHPNIRDILVIGAGDGGVVRELTRYDRVERIDLVEYLQYTFGVFLPEGQSEGEVVILQLTGDDEEKAECYDAPENETLEQAAFDLFCAKNMSRFAFDGADGNDLL